MKIEKLIIQNLNSIEDAEIVFSEGILAQEPLFLICGATGSGKTTILDAITLALYDKVSRYEKVKNKEQTEKGITTKDPYNILRNGKYDGKAELHFSVKNTHYIATWSVHKTKSNSYTSTNRRKLEVVDGELRTVILDKISAVNKKIEELVGLTYEQFVRSVMLAQGEFNTFLVSDKAEQSEILEKLTGTEVYSKIAEVINKRKNEAIQSKKNAEILYNSVKDSVLKDEDVQLLEKQKLELENEGYERDSLLKQIEYHLNWIKKDNALKDEYDNAQSLYDNILNKIDSHEYKENKSLVDDYYSTSKIRERLNELQRDETEIDKLNRQFEDDANQLSALKFSLQNVKAKKQELESLKSDVSAWIVSHRDKEKMYQNVNMILGLLKEMSQTLAFKRNKEMELVMKEERKRDVGAKLGEFLENLERIRKNKAEADNIVDALLADFNSDEQDRLIDEYQKKNSLKQNTLDRISQLKTVRTILEQYLNLNQNIKNEKLRYDGLISSAEEKKIALNKARTDFERYDLEFQKQKNMVEGWAKTLRSKMKEGETCPVCGGKVLYYNDENVVTSLYSSLSNEWDRMRSVLEQTQNELNKIESELSVLGRNIASDMSRLKILFDDLNQRCNGNPVFELERIDSTINKHNESVKKYDEEIEAVNVKLKEMALMKNKIETAQRNKKTIEEDFVSVERQLVAKQNELQEIELSLIALKTTVSESETKFLEKKSSVNEYLDIENWEKSWNDDSFAFTEMLNESAKMWNKKNDALRDIDGQIINLENIIAQCEKYLASIFDIVPEWKNIGLKESFVEEENVVPYLSAIYEKVKDRILRKSALENEKLVLKQEIDDFVGQSSAIDYERLKILNQISDIQTVAQKNKYLDDELIKVKNTLAIKNEELIMHHKDDNRPLEDMTVEGISARKISLLEEKKAKEEQLSEIKTKLAMDMQNHSKLVSCRNDFEKVANECHLWEQLAKAVGATEGNNFRDIAQAYTMGILLNRANYYMCQLSSRYRLCNNTDSLAIMVQDLEMGGELRTASSLSGGETFLVSLALALGLTSLNDEHFNTDMLFIDEGFGTLDADSLDMVMNTLENLHNLGRRVGIISHVDTLKERIPAQIQLIREGKSASKVRVIRN